MLAGQVCYGMFVVVAVAYIIVVIPISVRPIVLGFGWACGGIRRWV